MQATRAKDANKRATVTRIKAASALHPTNHTPLVILCAPCCAREQQVVVAASRRRLSLAVEKPGICLVFGVEPGLDRDVEPVSAFPREPVWVGGGCQSRADNELPPISDTRTRAFANGRSYEMTCHGQEA